MKILYYIEKLQNTPFIYSQIQQVMEKYDVAILTNQDYQQLGYKRAPIYKVTYYEPYFIQRIRYQFEISDLSFNYVNPIYKYFLKKTINYINPEIIHCQFGYDAVKLISNYYSIQRKYIITFRGYDASLKLILVKYTRSLSRILSLPNVFPIFVSNSLKNNIIDKGITFNNLHKVLYSNTDTEFFIRSNYSQDRSVIKFVQVSNFREKKGHIYTIRAFEHFKSKNPHTYFKLVFVGEKGYDYHNLLGQIKASSILDNIEFVGSKSRMEVKNIMESAHFFVHHSIKSKFDDEEGIPNSVMEAMSMELPILTTYHSGLIELDDGNTDIFYAEEKNILMYASNIEKAVKMNKYSSKNRMRIEKYFSKNRFLKEISDFYLKVSTF